MENEGPWLDPHHLRKKKVGTQGGVKDKEAISKFFVTNLPQGSTPWEISEFVKVFGEVAGVYIARKKDKFGNRFGFISFKNVRDVKELERALNGTKMGNAKLKVNLARFAVENANVLDTMKPRKNAVAEESTGELREHLKPRNQGFIKDGGGKLFSELFSNGNREKMSGQSNMSKEGLVVEVYDNISAFKDLAGMAAVGRCKSLSILNNLFSLMSKDGTRDFSISYLGGLSVLVKFLNEEACNSFVGNHPCWNAWFSSLDHWVGQSLPFERIAWLRLVGVPIHLAEDEVYDSIARRFGKIVFGSQRTSEDVDLSVNCVGVLRGDGCRIEEVVSLVWKDKRFKIWVEEVAEEWTPEGLEEDVSILAGNSSSEKKSSEFELEVQGSKVMADAIPGLARVPNCLHGEGEGGLDNKDRHAKNVEVWGNPEEILAAQGEVSGSGGAQPGNVFSDSGIVKKLKKKPFNILKDSHPRRPISVSQVNEPRPKKRSRMDLEEPNWFTWPAEIVNHRIVDAESPGNKSVGDGASVMEEDRGEPLGHENGETSMEVPETQFPGPVPLPEDEVLQKEIEATIDLGNILGAALSGHTEIVKEALIGEGNNAVSK
ncbi:putative RNA recognition motif domain, nucleotide-binding alpha-beta plait domain superfamily [Helianthus annuus]|nr:putative RNA recognition motif domain, nucleotide-binding alpha-beta plait domain superfamily [Helianthus annuus]